MGIAVAALLIAPTVAQNVGGIGVTTVLTGSMRPAIDPGDLLVTRTVAASMIGIGDVVVVTSSDVPLAHRVVDVRPVSGLQRLTTKGDANAVIDIDPVMVSLDRQIPRVIARVPAVGAPLAFLASPQAQRLGLTMLVGANLLALVLFALRRQPAAPADKGGGDPDDRPHPTHADNPSVNA